MNYQRYLQLLGPRLGDCAVSLYNWNQYRIRRSGSYHAWFEYFLREETLPLEQVMSMQQERLATFLEHATSKSAWYSGYKGASLSDFPILQKADLVENLKQISTLSEKDGFVSYTGGTTAASLKVIYAREDLNERFALLDGFRKKFGYELGERVAWFSGKQLVFGDSRKASRYWRTDWLGKIRFYSTFDISHQTAEAYWENLINFRPRFIVGFPSSVCELAKLAEEGGLNKLDSVEYFFPTAESVTSDHRQTVQRVLGAQMVDQYASSEGAPFITECQRKRLHIRPLSGVFEVLDDDGNRASSGRLVVTSFATRGTPLIRYDTGDRVALAQDESCECGSELPLVEYIHGRRQDFLFNAEGGKVNLGNLSNCTKGVNGIIQIQFIQEKIGQCCVQVQAGSSFKETDCTALKKNLQFALREESVISVSVVDQIPREKSGKHRIIKNLVVERQ